MLGRTVGFRRRSPQAFDRHSPYAEAPKRCVRASIRSGRPLEPLFPPPFLELPRVLTQDIRGLSRSVRVRPVQEE